MPPTIHELDAVFKGPRRDYRNVVHRYHAGLQKNDVDLKPCPYDTSEPLFFDGNEIPLKAVPSLIKEKVLPLATWNVDFREKYPFDHDVVLTTPEQIDKAVVDLEDAINKGKLKAGDILDIENHRGIGYSFIFENSVGELLLNRTEGEYGIVLPKEAYRYVRKFGVMTYASLAITGNLPYLCGCRIPIHIAQINHKRLGKMNIPLDSAVLVWQPGFRGSGFEELYDVDFAGEHILKGLLGEMTADIYSDLRILYATAYRNKHQNS